MRTPEYVLAFDPSGSFEEGKGVTGWCVFHKDKTCIKRAGTISSIDFKNPMEYFQAHVDLIEKWLGTVHNLHVVVEDYLLYANKMEAQINSRMETSQLIGVLKYTCWQYDIPIKMQPASLVKARWANSVLVYKGYLVPKGKGFRFPDADFYISKHTLDAVRHAVHYATFYERKKTNDTIEQV